MDEEVEVFTVLLCQRCGMPLYRFTEVPHLYMALLAEYLEALFMQPPAKNGMALNCFYCGTNQPSPISFTFIITATKLRLNQMFEDGFINQ